jgi:hypothetical protein
MPKITKVMVGESLVVEGKKSRAYRSHPRPARQRCQASFRAR